jgi:hypothetical protein
MSENDYEDFYELPEYNGEAEKAVDEYFLKAQGEIKGLYEVNKESVFFIRQLQVKLEKKYYHWVTNNAIIGLYSIRYLKDVRIPKEMGTSTRFFIHRSNRYAKREINRMEKVIEEYSQSLVTRGCGHRAEDLFCKGLAMRGFMPAGTKIREYKGKKWEKTGHDLDFIFKREGREYGCEIKNTLGYIDKEELEIKLEMCAFFGVMPLFIMRYSPKAYNFLIIKGGGFALLFETQIYELGQEDLVRRVRETLGLPVDCPRAIPEGIIDRFDKWDRKKGESL